METSTIIDPQALAQVELWILRFLVLLFAALGVWGMGREQYRKQVIYGDKCPRCASESFHRIHRTKLDRILGYGMNVYRYRCKNPDCGWEGLRRLDDPLSSPHHKTKLH
jgi:predicted RNA-binding Zn-ribbon protein involved in translation (DUF1610 family)